MCEVILAGTPEIDFWLQPPGSREAKVEKLKLLDLPERPDQGNEASHHGKTGFDTKVWIQIRDLGFLGNYLRVRIKCGITWMEFSEENP